MRTLTALAVTALLFACDPVPSGTDGGGGGCPAPSGSGTTVSSGSVSTATTWTAANSPYAVTTDLSIYAKLTLEPCTVVTIGVDKTITVNPMGSLVSQGTATSPVIIKAADGAANWASIRFIGGTGDLSYTTLDKGGAPLNIVPDLQGTLDIRSGLTTPTAPDPVLRVDHVTIKGSGTNGFRMINGGGFTADSTDLTITGSASHAGSLAPQLASTIPPGTYTGNGIDSFLMTDEGVRFDTTLHDRGIAYEAGGLQGAGIISVGGTTNIVTLTVEPGVTWKFKKGTGLLQLDPGGTPCRALLLASGTAAKPITFTSADPAPTAGDWLGIWMGGDDPRNKLDFVKILYAGKLATSGSNSCQSVQMGTTHNGGALRVYKAPPNGLITNSEIADSQTNGIDRGWRDNNMPSLLSGNTFTRVSLCKETQPRDMNGACPMPLPCP